MRSGPFDRFQEICRNFKQPYANWRTPSRVLPGSQRTRNLAMVPSQLPDCRQFASYRNRVGPERPLLKSVALLLEDAQHRNNSFSWIGEDELRRRGWDVEG